MQKTGRFTPVNTPATIVFFDTSIPTTTSESATLDMGWLLSVCGSAPSIGQVTHDLRTGADPLHPEYCSRYSRPIRLRTRHSAAQAECPEITSVALHCRTRHQ